MNFYLSFLAYNCWRIIITVVIAYLLGSVNTAVIVTKIVTGGKKDIREMGWLIFSTIPADSQILSNEFGNCGKYIAGIFAILGHSYPVYFHFKGGKGVVTAAALIASEDWRVFIAVIAAFLIVFACSKIISLSSITAAVLYGPFTFLATFLFDYPNGYSLGYVILSTVAALIIGIFVIVKHKDNIKRLMRGEEKKITAKKKTNS